MSEPADGVPTSIHLTLKGIQNAVNNTQEKVGDLKQSVTDLRAEVRSGYLTHDQFKPVADEVKSIKSLFSTVRNAILLALVAGVMALLGFKGIR